ncbi:MAG: hypothetical protein JHC76_07780, partial [Akkermansiaceae bacterium]|nr:hypothetical protein [Akkermansiaceae bacterium]
MRLILNMKHTTALSFLLLTLFAGAGASAHAATLTLRQYDAANMISVFRENVAE